MHRQKSQILVSERQFEERRTVEERLKIDSEVPKWQDWRPSIVGTIALDC